MKATYFIMMLFVTAQATVSQAQNSHKSYLDGPSHFELNPKLGMVWGVPLQPLTNPEREMFYELEVDYVKGHAVFSAYGALGVVTHHNLSPLNNWELGVLLGSNWHAGHSVLEIKAGVFGLNGVRTMNTGPDASSMDVPYTCLGEIVDFTYKYEILDHIHLGLSVPFTHTKYFFNTGVNLSLGYDIST